jgi:cysteamine dioxygenase
MSLFFIPAGGSLPLHDHPRMCVLSKVLAGDMHLQAFSRMPHPNADR